MNTGNDVTAQPPTTYSVEGRTDARLRLLENGYSPLPNYDKMCLLEGWPEAEIDEALVRRWGRGRAFLATGLRLDNGLCAIDFDVNHEAALDLYDSLLETYPELAEGIMRQGKGFKEAWFVRTSEPFPRIAGPLLAAPGAAEDDEAHRVEVFGGGSPRQFGALGWHTHEGLEYQWVEARSPMTVPLADLPEFTEEEISRIVQFTTEWLLEHGFTVISEEGMGRTDPDHVFDLTSGMIFVTREDGEVSLDRLRQIAGGPRGSHYYCSASFVDGPVAKNTRRCSVSLGHDGGLAIWDSMTLITHHEAEARPMSEEERDEAANDLSDTLRDLPGEEPAPVNIDRRWVLEYIFTAEGTIRQNEANIATFLRQDEWQGVFSVSDFDHDIWIMRPMPDDERALEYPRRLTDNDLFHVLGVLQHDVFPSASPQKVKSGVTLSAIENRHHGPRDYLASLDWDGVERLRLLPETCLGTELKGDEAYVRSVLRKWMISAVARVHQPGCKADHMLVLQGEQGAGKSSFFAALGGMWFGDDMPPVGLKDAKEWIRGQWIAEVAELGAISGRDIEHVKAFLTTRTDKFRKAYGSVVETVPRQVVFAGSTNDDEYLIDPTGGRRFWPLHVGKIDVEGIKRDRDQLWAEAAAAYHAGEAWHLDQELEPEALSVAQEVQEQARSKFMEEEPIRRWLRRQRAEEGILTYDVAVGALDQGAERVNPVLQHRIPRIMSMLGWVKDRRTKMGAVWIRGPRAEPYRVQETADTVAAKAAARDMRLVNGEAEGEE